MDNNIWNWHSNKYFLLDDPKVHHRHTVDVIRDTGNGISSYSHGHSHYVKDGIVQPKFGHTHKLSKWEGFAGGVVFKDILLVLILAIILTITF